MISDLEAVEARLAMEAYRDLQNQPECDSDSDLTDLVPALGRLLGWLNEGEKCEQKGMRVVAMLIVVRPDFIQQKSLSEMSPTSKQNLSKLVVDFRSTFGWRPSAHQIAKNSKV
jgi:hypothetical protein